MHLLSKWITTILTLLIIVCLAVAGLLIYSVFSSTTTVEAGNLEDTTGNFTSNLEVTRYVRSTGLPLYQFRESHRHWDCNDYAEALAERARIDGVNIGLALEIEYLDSGTKVHMTNYVRIGNKLCKVSAQTARVTERWAGIVTIKVD